MSKISQKEIKLFRSLAQAKFREKTKCFLIEGIKPVFEALKSDYSIDRILCSKDISAGNMNKIARLANDRNINVIEVEHFEIDRISTHKNPEGILGVGKIRDVEPDEISYVNLPGLYFWKINDPGNMGTIFRTALWFGVKQIFLSPGSVDHYNPKVVRASMGALFHLQVFPGVSVDRLTKIAGSSNAKIICADISGSPVISGDYEDDYVLVFGSESHGLPEQLLQIADETLKIGKRGYGESLNLGVSVGILLGRLGEERQEKH